MSSFAGRTKTAYPDPEPDEPNATTRLSPVKWSKVVSSAPIEGAKKYRYGVYRPQERCRMLNLTDEFCAVCEDAIRRVLAPFRGRRRAVRS